MGSRAAILGWVVVLATGCDLLAGLDNPKPLGSGTTTTSTGTGGTGGGTGGGSTGGDGGATCGNGTQEAGEECDDSNQKDADGCEADCTLPRCGNGIVDPGELCFTTPFIAVPVPFPAGFSNNMDSLELVDCDADGDLDIVTSSLAALRNDGKGAFKDVVQTDSNSDSGLALADLGGGSYELVAVSAGTGRTIWYSPDPAATCKYMPTIGISAQGGFGAFVILDVNGNTIPDVVKAFDGQGGFYGKLYTNVDHDLGNAAPTDGWSQVTRGLAAGHFIGNTGDDLVVASTAEDKIVIVGNDNGAFPNNSLVLKVPAGGVGDQPVAVAVGDLDADGDPDIVSANLGSETIAVLHNLGAGTFAAQIPEPSVKGTNGVAAGKPRFVRLGDMNADGFLDAVSANSDDTDQKSSVSVFLNDGTGKLLLATKANFAALQADSPFEVGRQPLSVRLGDLNGDGVLDIATVNAYAENNAATVSVLLSNP